MKKLTQTLKYWSQLLLLPIYWFSFITPRNKNIWLFGSTFGRRFADNPKYMYLYVNQFKASKIRGIWISQNKKIISELNSKGCEAYYYRSLKGIYYCLRAKVYIFDNYSKDISFWLSGGAKKINLWHGTATKKINQDNKFDHNRHPGNLSERLNSFFIRLSNEKPDHYVLATSENMTGIMSSAFGVDKSHVLAVGHPRNDILFHDGLEDLLLNIEEKTVRQLKKWKNKGFKLIYYAPTFRDSEDKFFKIIDLAGLNKFLKENNYLLISKLHIKSKLKQKFQELDYSNIKYMHSDVDTSTVLEYADMLIVDYSSIYLDYMMLERPVIAFPFDYKEYLSTSRECYFDYDEYMPEIKAYSQKDLEEGIRNIFENDTCFDKRMKRRDFHFVAKDSKSCERLYGCVKEILAGKY